MTPQTLRAGILGTGFMGQQHGQRLKKMPAVEVAAICDTNLDSATKLKDSLECQAALFADFDAMLAATALDILYVCLPPCAHTGQVEKAAAKGIHLFLEKPIAPNVKHAQSMVDAIEKAGVVSQVGFHMRFRKGVERLKALVESGEAGNAALFDGRYWCNMLGGAWWRDINGSGGQVYEQVIHVYDMARYFLGTPRSVSAFMGNLCHTDVADYTIEDVSVASVLFENGAVASINGCNCAVPDRFVGDWRVVFRNAVLDYRSAGDWRVKEEGTVTVHGTAEPRSEEFVEDGDSYGEEDADFIAAVRTGGSTRTPAREGLEAVRLVSAVIESAKSEGNVVGV